GAAIAELPMFAFFPALDVAVRPQRTRIAIACRDLDSVGDALHFDRYVRVRPGAIPELPSFVVSPALDVAARNHQARLASACGDLGGAGHSRTTQGHNHNASSHEPPEHSPRPSPHP